MRGLLHHRFKGAKTFKSLLAIVLVIAFLVQATFPPVSAAMQQSSSEKIIDDDQMGAALLETEAKGVLRVHPLGESDTMILFPTSTAYLSVTGTSMNGSAFAEIIPVEQYAEEFDVVLPYGEYLITAHYAILEEGYEHYPSYFLSKQVTVNEETDYDYTVIGGGSDLARMSVNTATSGTTIASVCLYPEGRNRSTPTTIQPGSAAKVVYITPGSYNMIIAVTDGSHAYFLSTSLVAEEDEEITINADLNFTASFTTDKNEYLPGEKVDLTCNIVDSFGNRLIGKTTGLPLLPFSSGYTFSDEAPVVEIKNETGDINYSDTKKANNAALYEYWASWSPNINTELFPMLSLDSTYDTSSYIIPGNDPGGIRTINATLGEGPHTLSTTPSSFHIKGEVGKPVLDPLQSPTNASSVIVTGTAAPNTQVTLSYSYNQGASESIGSVTSDLVIGRFSFTYTPVQDGTYTFTANDSVPVSVLVDRTPTGAPVNLTGTVNEQSGITLTWEAPVGEAPVKYEVFRDGTSFGMVTGTTYVDTTVETGKEITYTYLVYALDHLQNRSDKAETTVEITLPEEPVELVLSNVSWQGSWDRSNHINMQSTVQVTVKGTSEMDANFDLEYIDQTGATQILTTPIFEIRESDGKGTGVYEGVVYLQEGTAKVVKITGRIVKGAQKIEKEVIGLPVFVNSNLIVTLTGVNPEIRKTVAGAELSVWSQSKYSGAKVKVTDTLQCNFTKLVPADDYVIKLTVANRVIAQSDGNTLSAGIKNNIELAVTKTPATLDVWVVDQEGKPIKQANINVFSKENNDLITWGTTNEEGKASHYQFSSGYSEYLLESAYAGDELIISITIPDFQKYITPVKIQKILEPGINNITVSTIERGKATIKGTVYTEHGETLSAATVTVYCDTGNNTSIPYSVQSDANGNYSLEVLSGKARVVVSHRLSRSKEFTIDPLLTGETRQESFWFPIERTILLDIKFKDIGEPEGYNDLLKEQKVKLTVTNKGTLENPKRDTLVTARGDDRYLAVPNAEPGDIIEVVANGQSAGYDIKTVLSSPLDENCWAVMNIQLSEVGKVRATFTDLYQELNYPVYLTAYRQNGEAFEYVTQISTFNPELVTSPLLQGRYNIFVHTKPVNAGIRYQYFVEDVGDNAILYSDVDVTNGVITFIGESIVKKYEDTSWGYFRDNEGNEIRASMTDVIPGGMTTITVSYKYFDTQPLRKLNFFIDIPEGSTYIEDSIKITPKNNSKTPKPYFLTGKDGEVETINLLLGGSFQLPLGDLEGSVSFNIRFDEEPGNVLSTARYYAEFDGIELGMREHIGEVIFSTPHVSIYAEADIFEHTIPVSGRAPKNALVKIYDSAYFVGEARANQHGLWSTTVTLPDRGMPNNHYLSAQIQNKAGDPVTSEIIECSYDTDRPRITKIVFGVEGMFKKVIKKNETFRYRPEDGKKQEVEIYFDDATRIRDVRLMSATGYILVNEEDVVYHEGEHMFSASWLAPLVADEIRVSYRVAKPEAKLSDYAPVAEDVLRSGLSDLWGKSTFIQLPALEYNESKDIFEINSKVMLGDKNSIVSTTMEISNYEGELPPGYSNDADLPIGNLYVKFNDDDTFEISFIMPRDVIFQEVLGENQDRNQARLMSAASIPLIATRVPQQLVRVFGKKTVIEAGLDSYSLVDTFLGGHSTAKFLEKVYALENEIKSPCYNQQDYYSYQDRRDIALLEHDTKFLFGAKSVLSIAFLGLGFIPVVGWGAAIGLAVATTVAGYLVDKGIEAYQDHQYEGLRSRIRGRAKPGCHWPRDNYKDDSDTVARPRPFTPIDPSGYVYEGVASNRLPGVVTTAYELIEEQWQVWDAEWFAQENPLITNEIGFYQWDVPEGWWMVKYEKEGYEIAYSDKLPVPPPQLDVNIAMYSKKLPEVSGAVIDHEGKVTLTFSQYMDVSNINAETFKLYEKATDNTGNLIAVAGSISAPDAEANPVDANLILARTFVFTPATAPKVGDIFTLWVDDMPVNYAGRSMESEYTVDVTVPEKQDPPPEEPGDEDDDDDVVGSIEPIIIPERQVRIFNHQLKDGEDPNTVVVYRKDPFGNFHMVKECYYDPVTKMIRFVAKPATIYITGINPVLFDDMGTWADEYIMFLAARGIIHGIGNNKFEPNRSVTHAEFIKLLACLAEDDFEQGDPWYVPYINWALERSVIAHKDTDFNQPLSREDMAILIANFAQAVKLEIQETHAEIMFKDQEHISQKAIDAVVKMQKSGLLEGKPGRMFDPKGFTTRAEVAKIIATLLKMMVK